MKKLVSMRQFSLKQGQANFLLGVAGNGLSTQIQHEIYSKDLPGVYYVNYVGLNDSSETGVLVSIANGIIKACGCTKHKLSPDDYSEIFGVFTDMIKLIRQNKENAKPALLIFDEFQKIREFSNSFYFTLDKIFSINQIIPEFELTSVLISDSYLNPRSENPSEGIGKLFSHYPNFHIINNFTARGIAKSGFAKRYEGLSDTKKKRLLELTGGIPSLVGLLLGDGTLTKAPKVLLEDYEIEWKLHEIWESVGKDNQKILIDVLIKKQFTPRNKLQHDYLTKSGLVAKDKNEIVPILFRTFVSKQINLDIIQDRRHIMINDEPVYLERLSPQEEKIILLLYDNSGSLVTREQIAKALWGKHYLEKFSDYAIDKIISQVRSILPQTYGGESLLHTKRGEGYILQQ